MSIQRTLHENMYQVHQRAESALSAVTERVRGGFMTTSPRTFRVELVTPTAQYAIRIQPDLAGRKGGYNVRGYEAEDMQGPWKARVEIDGRAPIDVRAGNIEQAVAAAVGAADEALAVAGASA